MYHNPYMYAYQYPYYFESPINYYISKPSYWTHPNDSRYICSRYSNGGGNVKDFGSKPFVVDINKETVQNDTFRTSLWTGTHLQTTLMSIDVGDDIGLEIHPDVDQFLRIEQGQGITRMGKNKNNLNLERKVLDDFAIFIPAGTWHNLINTGNVPLKLYSIYAPPNHPFGTVRVTKADAIAAEEAHSNEYTNVFGKTPDEWVQYIEF